MSEPITLSEGNFQKEVLESDVPVLVDYWAAWCGPCRVLGPVIEEIARERGGSLKGRQGRRRRRAGAGRPGGCA